jgi:hypothetical protein
MRAAASVNVCQRYAFCEGRSANLITFLEIMSGMNMEDRQLFKEAMWSDNLMIMLVFYEALTSKADIEDIMRLRGDDAQFILNLAQDVSRFPRQSV